MVKCEYLGDHGETCSREAASVLRLIGPIPPNPLALWRPKVCREHEVYLQSAEVKMNGRDWEFLDDLPRNIKEAGR